MHTRYTAAAAQVEAEKCAVIAKEVSEKQANCERDLAAAEPLVEQAEAALDTLNKKLDAPESPCCGQGRALLWCFVVTMQFRALSIQSDILGGAHKASEPIS
eukprot:1157319-Pelagomonas_calceolata.AAC.13